MNRKPVLIIVYTLLIAVVAFFALKLFVFAKPGKKEVVTFLTKFSTGLHTNTPESMLGYFDSRQKKKVILSVITALTGISEFNGKDTALINVTLRIDNSDIKMVNNDVAEANIPVDFSFGNEEMHSTINFKLRKDGNDGFKIVQFDARKFLPLYIAFEEDIKDRFLTDEQRYAPQTLAAFKTAAVLKNRYDSVIWFTHINNQTYFYVEKNKTAEEKNANPQDSARFEKMGLLNPALTEIIPTEYDLIHNISGTFIGLIEVEKGPKRGFYNLAGKLVLPVEYDQIFPVDDPGNLAVLRRGNDYFYLKKDTTVSEKVDLKVGDFISRIKFFGSSYVFQGKETQGITEYNSRDENFAVYICPSYLVDLNMVNDGIINFKNPLRQHSTDYFAHIKYDAKFMGKEESTQSNWIKAAYYYIVDRFLGDRSSLYTAKQIVVADQKRNRILGLQMPIDYTDALYSDEAMLPAICNENAIRMFNDSLYEVKTTAAFAIPLYNKKEVDAGPYYHYIEVKDGKLHELTDRRKFNFTKYVKMDDTYLTGCYAIGKKRISSVNADMLRYMKNEIYASYRYRFKDKHWVEIFNEDPESGELLDNLNANVDDSLTVIDKYNINFINQKLKGVKAQPSTLAAN